MTIDAILDIERDGRVLLRDSGYSRKYVPKTPSGIVYVGYPYYLEEVLSAYGYRVADPGYTVYRDGNRRPGNLPPGADIDLESLDNRTSYSADLVYVGKGAPRRVREGR